ncbi:MAG: orotidine-5'-phosphate decarboxylase [Zavarzinia sp.]|nr:orotidine-5'-phosphate decarboxylase [Zavarzinia sp.]
MVPQRLDIPLRERLIVALDLPRMLDARNMVAALGDEVVFYKLGLQQVFGGGLGLVDELFRLGKKVFLDAKLTDIAATVGNATTNIARTGCEFLTVTGDAPIVRAAVEARSNAGARKPLILAVTVLTSLDQRDIEDMGFSMSLDELVAHRALKAKEAGADGVIASGFEAARLRALLGPEMRIVTPGIRSADSPKDDQKRVMTAGDAIRAGADHVVVGRDILRSAKPAQKARAILDDIADAL